jgi:hypothetical protein
MESFKILPRRCLEIVKMFREGKSVGWSFAPRYDIGLLQFTEDGGFSD